MIQPYILPKYNVKPDLKYGGEPTEIPEISFARRKLDNPNES